MVLAVHLPDANQVQELLAGDLKKRASMTYNSKANNAVGTYPFPDIRCYGHVFSKVLIRTRTGG